MSSMGDFVFTPSIQQRELIEPSQSKVRKRSNVWNPFLCGWQPRKQHLDPLFSTSLNVCSIIILNVFVGKFHVQKRLFALRGGFLLSVLFIQHSILLRKVHKLSPFSEEIVKNRPLWVHWNFSKSQPGRHSSQY